MARLGASRRRGPGQRRGHRRVRTAADVAASAHASHERGVPPLPRGGLRRVGGVAPRDRLRESGGAEAVEELPRPRLPPVPRAAAGLRDGARQPRPRARGPARGGRRLLHLPPTSDRDARRAGPHLGDLDGALQPDAVRRHPRSDALLSVPRSAQGDAGLARHRVRVGRGEEGLLRLPHAARPRGRRRRTGRPTSAARTAFRPRTTRRCSGRPPA